MDSRLQKRVQRYGWDLAAPTYEPLWRAQLAGAQVMLLDRGPEGEVFGVDLSGQMVGACQLRADVRQVSNARFARMDGEKLDFTDGRFDVAVWGEAALCGWSAVFPIVDAVFVGGPVALAWSRFDAQVRTRVRRRYLESIAPWRHGRGYRIPAEFVVASGTATGHVQPVATPNPYLELVP